jgi:hypothetical protein
MSTAPPLTNTQARDIIRKAPDPLRDHNSSTRPTLPCRDVHRVFQPDRDGLVEVLYLANDGPEFINGVKQPSEPMTAYLRREPKEPWCVVSIADGW